MELDYEWTCYIIDEAISDADAAIENMFTDVLDNCDPELSEEQKQSLMEYLDSTVASEFFEKCRSSNENMRSAANDQLTSLNEEKSQAEEGANDECIRAGTLESTVSELESKIEELESEIENLQTA